MHQWQQKFRKDVCVCVSERGKKRRCEDTEIYDVSSDKEMDRSKADAWPTGHMPFSWMLSLAFPNRLGEASSMLIQKVLEPYMSSNNPAELPCVTLM